MKYQAQTSHHRHDPPLPFDKLSDKDFERFCLWLVAREGYHSAEHLGISGSEQGRDITVFKGEERWAFQCKRVQHFGFADAETEIKKLTAGEGWVKYVFIVSSNVSAVAREQVRAAHPEMEILFWAQTELDEMVKRHPEIAKEFFQLPPEGMAVEAYQPPKAPTTPKLPFGSTTWAQCCKYWATWPGRASPTSGRWRSWRNFCRRSTPSCASCAATCSRLKGSREGPSRNTGVKNAPITNTRIRANALQRPITGKQSLHAIR